MTRQHMRVPSSCTFPHFQFQHCSRLIWQKNKKSENGFCLFIWSIDTSNLVQTQPLLSLNLVLVRTNQWKSFVNGIEFYFFIFVFLRLGCLVRLDTLWVRRSTIKYFLFLGSSSARRNLFSTDLSVRSCVGVRGSGILNSAWNQRRAHNDRPSRLVIILIAILGQRTSKELVF